MRPRNSEREKYVANKQARYLGMDPKDVLGMIDRKGGDYYRSDLYPDQSVISQAEDDFSTFRTGTTAMNQIADDMRSYYGVESSQPQRVMTNLPPEIEAQVAAVSEPYVRPQPRTAPQPKPQPRIEEQAVSQQESPQMRERIMGGLRKAGEAIRGFDDAYSAKIRNMYEGASPAVQVIGLTLGGGHPSTRKAEVMREIGPETRMDQAKRQVFEYGLPAVNAVPKYVLPAAGITLAGQGLMAVAQGLNQQSSGTIEM